MSQWRSTDWRKDDTLPPSCQENEPTGSGRGKPGHYGEPELEQEVRLPSDCERVHGEQLTHNQYDQRTCVPRHHLPLNSPELGAVCELSSEGKRTLTSVAAMRQAAGSTLIDRSGVASESGCRRCRVVLMRCLLRNAACLSPPAKS